MTPSHSLVVLSVSMSAPSTSFNRARCLLLQPVRHVLERWMKPQRHWSITFSWKTPSDLIERPRINKTFRLSAMTGSPQSTLVQSGILSIQPARTKICSQTVQSLNVHATKTPIRSWTSLLAKIVRTTWSSTPRVQRSNRLTLSPTVLSMNSRCCSIRSKR